MLLLPSHTPVALWRHPHQKSQTPEASRHRASWKSNERREAGSTEVGTTAEALRPPLSPAAAVRWGSRTSAFAVAGSATAQSPGGQVPMAARLQTSRAMGQAASHYASAPLAPSEASTAKNS
jgi:hypothetical protein